MRIRVPAAKGDVDVLKEISQALSSVECVQEVKVNEALGTVTIHYDHSRHDQLHKHLTGTEPHHNVALEKCPNLADLSHIDEMIEKEAEFLARHSHAANALFQLCKRVDEGVKRISGNAIDLKVLAPLALAVGVFAELGASAATPVWLTLGLFSFNHFVELHTHPQKEDAPETSPEVSPEPAPAVPVKPTRPRAKRKPARFP